MNYKILMVDDDRELLKMLNQYFTLKWKFSLLVLNYKSE